MSALSDFDTNILLSQKRKYQTKEMFLRGHQSLEEKPKIEALDFFSFLPGTI